MIRKILAATMMAIAFGQANAAMVAGDLAFTSFNADEDGFSLVTFVDLDPNTVVYFSDNEWNGSAIGSGGAFNTGESYTQWNTGASIINAGSVIRFNNVDSATLLGASTGAFSRVSVSGSTNFGLANSNETIYSYLGTSATAPTTFLTVLTNGNFGVDGSIANTGVTQGVTAMDLNGAATTSPDFGQYNGARSGLTTIEAYKPLVANNANWTVDDANGNYAATIPDTTNLSVTPVPLPAAVWLFGSALMGLMGLRRRKA